MRYFAVLLIVFFAQVSLAQPQGKVIDQVVGVVGSKVILLSDIENQYIQNFPSANNESYDVKCEIFENILFQKLLLNQADIDSVTVTDAQVDGEIDRRLRYFVSQIGSEKKLEEYFKKSIFEIKEEMKESVRDMLLTQQVESKITDNIKVTPTEVRSFFNSQNPDSLPRISSEIEIAQIVKKAIISPEAKTMALEKIKELRERIMKGEDFSKLAILYSEDPGSARKGGELGFYGRGELYPEFEAIAFGLKNKEVSGIVETSAGYHIIQLVERKGEQVNVRHILIMPKISNIDLVNTEKKLDTVYSEIINNKVSFSEAAEKYSDDDSKKNGGVYVNPQTGASKVPVDQLESSIFFVADKLKPGEISRPTLVRTQDGKQSYVIIKLISRSQPHIANLQEDYQMIQNAALEDKKDKAISAWIAKKKKDTYIQINGDYKGCVFKHKWD